MKTLLSLTLLLSIVLVLTLSAVTASEHHSGKLRHVVSFKFKESASKAQIEEIEQAFENLKTKISEIVSYEAGTNVSPENLNKGFTHAFILTFDSAEDRDAYLVHPDHKKFANQLRPILEDVFVIDFWAE